MDLVEQDLKHVWHPCSQMKDYEAFLPLPIRSAQGSYFELEDGRKIIDAISSWWCKLLGHGHPRLKAALQQQMQRFEHVILTNTTHTAIVQLSQHLAALSGLNKVFYASDGACAIEIAIKMSLHSRYLRGQPQRTKIMALENSYHGETLGALAISDLGLFRQPYTAILPEAKFIRGLPYVTSTQDYLWNDCSAYWPNIEAQLVPHARTLTALIIEPVLQGAGGMRIYSKDLLVRLQQWCKHHDVHLIADEILTGLGRTGLPLACQHAGIEPDFICLGKGLTAGWLPMSAVLTTDAIYEIFYNDYTSDNWFPHSHTYSGNALAAAVALECLQIIEGEAIYTKVKKLKPKLLQHMQEVAEQTGKLENIRSIGAMVAADLKLSDNHRNSRMGYQVFKHAVNFGAFLRPLGNTIYWLPPLNIELETLQELANITTRAIEYAFSS